jgi:hypothetical protein
MSASAQKGNTYFTQKEWIERAQVFEQSSDSTRTMVAYYYAYTEDPTTPEGIIALKKSNLLKAFFRNKILAGIQGVWKLTTYGSNWGHTKTGSDILQKYVRINGNNATFYQSNLKTGKHEVLQEEMLNFLELESNDYHLLNFRYANNEIWSFSVKDDVLSITEIGKVEGKFIGEIVCGNSEYYYSKVKN